MTLTDEQITISHLTAAANDCRTSALRNAKDIDALMSDLRHAIENGRTGAALSMLTSIDTLNRGIISVASTPIGVDEPAESTTPGVPIGEGFASYCNICGRSNGTHSYHCHNDR